MALVPRLLVFHIYPSSAQGVPPTSGFLADQGYGRSFPWRTQLNRARMKVHQANLAAQGILRVAVDGDAQDSLRRQIRLMPFIRALFREVSPIPCKCAMEMMGQCSGELRLPLIPAAEETRMALKKCLTELGYLKN